MVEWVVRCPPQVSSLQGGHAASLETTETGEEEGKRTVTATRSKRIKRSKETLIHYGTDIQSANFRGNSLRQAEKRQLKGKKKDEKSDEKRNNLSFLVGPLCSCPRTRTCNRCDVMTIMWRKTQMAQKSDREKWGDGGGKKRERERGRGGEREREL